jgi:hypothetical protein
MQNDFVEANRRYVQDADDRDALTEIVQATATAMTQCTGLKPRVTDYPPQAKTPNVSKRSWMWGPLTDDTWILALDLEQALVGKPVSKGVNDPQFLMYLYSAGR